MPINNLLTRIVDKTSVIGAIGSAMACSACFPAIASVGAAMGLGFLTQYEGVSIHYLLPLFGGIGLLANLIGGLRHRQWSRMVLGMVGPILVMAAALIMVRLHRPTEWLLYPGLVLMVAVAVWDLVRPPGKPRPEIGTRPAHS